MPIVHREARLVHVERFERDRVLRVGQGLTDGDVLESGDRHDVTGTRALGGDAFERLGDEEFVILACSIVPSMRHHATR